MVDSRYTDILSTVVVHRINAANALFDVAPGNFTPGWNWHNRGEGTICTLMCGRRMKCARKHKCFDKERARLVNYSVFLDGLTENPPESVTIVHDDALGAWRLWGRTNTCLEH